MDGSTIAIMIESTNRGRVCILLPVLNEAANVEALSARIAATLTSRAYTICFVDDGSNDGTVDLIQRLARDGPDRIHLIRRRKMMRGSQRGSALMTALQWAMSSPLLAPFSAARLSSTAW